MNRTTMNNKKTKIFIPFEFTSIFKTNNKKKKIVEEKRDFYFTSITKII